VEAEICHLADEEIERVLVLGEDEQPFVTAGEVRGDDAAKLLELGLGNVLSLVLASFTSRSRS
jgi:hypothetical protein